MRHMRSLAGRIQTRSARPDPGRRTPEQADELHKSDMRGQIITTAERLFRQLGFQKTTVADIARELGMSPGNVYRFFRSKEEINESVSRKLLAEVTGAAAAIAESERPASERLRDVLTALMRLNTERFTVDNKLHEMVALAISESWDVVAEYVRQMDAILADIIADGMKRGEFRAGDPLLAGRCVHTATIRFTHPRLMVECADFPDPALDQLIDFCLAALR